MSDFMEYAEYYKKAWESSLKERTCELQDEINKLQSKVKAYEEALQHIGTFSGPEISGSWAYDIAVETLKKNCHVFK